MSIKEALKSNGYPSNFIDNNIQPSNVISNNISQHSYKHATLPYINGLSQSMRRVFSRYDIKLHFKPNSTLKNQLTKLKDNVPMMKNNNLVYQIECSDCPTKYIGETKQRLEKRIQQHSAAIRRNDSNHSGMSQHCLENLHNFSSNNVKILRKNLPYYQSRQLIETVNIKKTRNNCNRDSGTVYSEIYNGLF